ncbi:hypothetical protein BDZ94DRAFT_1246188 [Collybia nuda]|uniref:Protein kinase domain-containing protein n=1 Tax=Collybia nuda TaxID=64659 RepID=A0A9P5YHJ2_9AGAR|nr:hypothetical protein BDZ94DRAFT_1246188 [Collybia nuda]
MPSPPPSVPQSPPLSPPHNATSHLDLYFGGEVFHSPENSDSDDSSGSDTTLEDIDSYTRFGHPLQRMFRLRTTDDEGMPYRNQLSSSSYSSSSTSSSSITSSVVYDIDYEALIDDLLEDNPTFKTETRNGNMLMVEPSSVAARDSLMIKRLPRTSSELYILLELNHPEYRMDPWNPAPHILCAVEREDVVFLCMERLGPYYEPPFKTVANYIDFFRQILEGLTFLHELNITQMSFQDPSCYMVDLSSAPGTCLLPADFDRSRYPVRYYFTNLSHATKFEAPSTPVSSSAFRHDVQDCGVMIDRLLVEVPWIEPKFKSLVKAMAVGGFGADDSRKLFEALCKSLESSIFEIPVPVREHNSRSSSTFSLLKSSNLPKIQSYSSS